MTMQTIERAPEAGEITHIPDQGIPIAAHMGFSSMELVKSSRRMVQFGRLLGLLFILILIGLIFLPWQQTVTGRGQLIAYKPEERQQTVMAPISGLITKWHVVEGSQVKVGDPIAELVDPDPQYEQRLLERKAILQKRLKEALGQAARRQDAINRIRESRKAQQDSADRAVNIIMQTLSAREKLLNSTEVNLNLAKKELELIEPLVEKGLRPEIELIQRNAKVAELDLAFQRANADVLAAKESVEREKFNRSRVDADTARDLVVAEQDLNRIQGETVEKIQSEIQEIDTTYSRYQMRFVKAPCTGTVFQILQNSSQSGSSLKAGDPLVIIVPDSNDYVAEIFIDGVDAPLIQRGPDGRYPHVRLQFEGWPAVQFTGWPSAAVGTFGGRVRQIDQTDNGKGQFRVLIEPDQQFENDIWPGKEYLRQGNQVVGWVFLNRVTLGWEVWRRLNGFPPVLGKEPPASPKSDDKK